MGKGGYPLSFAYSPAWIELHQGRRFPQFCWRKIGTPIAAGAAASRSLTRPAPYRAQPLIYSNQEAMMDLMQHVEELRAELAWNDDPAEIAQIRAELEAALAELKQQKSG